MMDRSSQIVANLLNRKQQIIRHIKEEKLKHLYWTFLEFTFVSKRLRFVSNRLYMCNESIATCIERTLYRNDREPISLMIEMIYCEIKAQINNLNNCS